MVTANTVREIALERSNLIGTNSTDMTGQENSSQQKILRVALPVSLEAVFQASLGFVDQVIVGILGAIAVAAVGLSNSISFIIMLLYSAIGISTGVLVAQAYGRSEMNEVSKIAPLGQPLVGVFGFCTGVPLILFTGPVLRIIGATDELASEGSGYFQLFSLSAPLIVMSAVTIATFRSLNGSKTPMVITMAEHANELQTLWRVQISK